MITSALQLYFTGESLQKCSEIPEIARREHQSQYAYRWIKNTFGLMKSYLEKITPNVSDAWRADELYLKVRGKSKIFICVDG